MEFRQIVYATSEYDRMVDLRIRVLKEPFNISFTEEEKETDKANVLLGAFFPNSEQIVGCCLLTSIDSESVIRLRQMAVDFFYQGKGLGAELIAYAETVAFELKYRIMYLHARKPAVGFYKKQGYTIEGDEFMEMGIPHFEMMKILE